ncbi:extracellular solute-binding protein [Jatrophihabitans telluris]|uniref:Extracellular solute-binding protein n=1 Tax=Jatrophihabitans telluris TaxID=2038343 RepID=A0ABY4R2A8_9ACTN|nr:extracellular solute-binding protein [Jatrophihabitans telluris]UQX89421.1 extracellular solute-binding protein [Jatrophihabitans telluris]
MKRTVAGAIVLAAAVAMTATACSSNSSSDKSSGGKSTLSTDGKGKTITVWLQSDAQKGWPAVVDQATQRFEAATGAKVSVQWQQWSNYTTKLDSTFAGTSGVPDVVELGNTQTASYIAGGAFTDLTSAKSQFENSSSWLQGLAESGTSSDGKLMAIPYYAGSRVVIYRKDLWDKAGVTTPPTSIAELNADLDKVKAANAGDSHFSAFYMPGKYWYAAMSFVYGAGGKIADKSGGKWSGQLSSAQAQQGLTQWQTLATKYSTGGATKDESDQDAIMAQGHVAAIAGNGWEVGTVTDAKTGNPKLASVLSTFPMPGTAAGQYTPSFLGGSDLAVPAKAPHAGLGAQWVKYFTDNTSQTALAKFAIPNTTSLLSVYEKQAQANQSTGEAAKNTWFVPNTPNWASVESNNILQNMLESIATGKSSVAAAAATADGQVASTLNAAG